MTPSMHPEKMKCDRMRNGKDTSWDPEQIRGQMGSSTCAGEGEMEMADDAAAEVRLQLVLVDEVMIPLPASKEEVCWAKVLACSRTIPNQPGSLKQRGLRVLSGPMTEIGRYLIAMHASMLSCQCDIRSKRANALRLSEPVLTAYLSPADSCRSQQQLEHVYEYLSKTTAQSEKTLAFMQGALVAHWPGTAQGNALYQRI